MSRKVWLVVCTSSAQSSCSSKPLRGSLFSDSVHGIPYTGVCRLVSLPDKVLREKEIP
ncbi:MAG: hypothetical protein ISS67_05435 [Desulfobacterales bacterium]|nr:hypothetical protein [Desulfobacterales bacterium]